MKFGIGILPEAIAATGRKAALAEKYGFDSIFTGDMQSTHRELHMSLAVMGGSTSRVTLGSGMTNPVTRDLGVTAGAFATLAEYTDGRAFIGLACGDSALHNIGLKPVKLDALETYIHALRQLLVEGKTEYQGRQLKLTWWKGGAIPIYMSAHGTRSLELAGKVADGVVVGFGLDSNSVDQAFTMIDKGARQSGRTLKDIDVWFLAHTNVGPDGMDAIRGIGATLAVSGNLIVRNMLRTVPERYHASFTALAERYDYSHHAKSSASSNATLIEELGLLDYIATRFAVAGTPEMCRAQLATLERLGVEQMWCSRALPDFENFVPAWSAAVMSPVGR